MVREWKVDSRSGGQAGSQPSPTPTAKEQFMEAASITHLPNATTVKLAAFAKFACLVVC